jgi:hypothetical protein
VLIPRGWDSRQLMLRNAPAFGTPEAVTAGKTASNASQQERSAESRPLTWEPRCWTLPR